MKTDEEKIKKERVFIPPHLHPLLSEERKLFGSSYHGKYSGGRRENLNQ